MIQYCSLLSLPHQISQEVTHSGTTLANACLIAKFQQIHGHYDFKMRYVKKGGNIHISTCPFLGDVGCHNHPLLGYSVPAGDFHEIFFILGVSTSARWQPLWACARSPISSWTIAMISFVMTHPNDTILSGFGSPKPDFSRNHPSWYYSPRSTLNYKVLMNS
jgi:hypothetical protein